MEAIDVLYRVLPNFSNSNPKTITSLDKILTLCSESGNPQSTLQFIHVAGTNGKGSVSHLLASLLMEAGYQVGLHTSPHLIDYRERTQVNGKLMDEHFIIEKVNTLLSQKWLFVLKPSFFDVSIWLAFEYFKYCQVDYVVLETGLGGKKDTTNIIHPLLAVITTIGYDHQAILGNTLSEIAAEKAGIIKANTPVVVGQYDDEYAHVFHQKAAMENAPIYFASQHYAVQQVRYECNTSVYQATHLPTQSGFSLTCPLSGTYQNINLQTFLQTVDVLNHLLPKAIPRDVILSATLNVKKNTHLRGRWDCVMETPTVILDGAHNTSAFVEVFQQLNALARQLNRQVVIIFGMLKDKDVDASLAILPKAYTYYFCHSSYERRKLDAQQLTRKAAAFDIFGKDFDSVQAAIDYALSHNREHIIFITGSLYIVGEALQYFDKQ